MKTIETERSNHKVTGGLKTPGAISSAAHPGHRLRNVSVTAWLDGFGD